MDNTIGYPRILVALLLALSLLLGPALAGLHPAWAAQEVCNGVDDDGDDLVDDADPDLQGAPLWYPDGDFDSYGDSSSPGVAACDPPAGHIANNQDSDDANPAVNPSATEVCNDIDDDSDGLVDDNDPSRQGGPIWYPDVDLDSFGDSTSPGVVACNPPADHIANNTDPDDDDQNNWSFPALDSVPDKTVAEGQLLSFVISGTDADGNALTYSMLNGPSGSSFAPATRTFSWRPGFDSAGPHSATLRASDGAAHDEITVDITVANNPATKTVLLVSKTRRKVKATGLVSPAHEGIAMTVKLYRRTGGRWALLATKRPALTATSLFATSFPRPGRAGRYKISARFPGDADSNFSSAAKTFRLR